MRNVRLTLLTVFAGTVIVGAMGCSAEHRSGEAQKGLKSDKVTAGTVRREIRVGMSGLEVVKELGAPNIVTTDGRHREVWLYDKIATDVTASRGRWTLLLLGQGAGATSKSQRTLTITIKFDHGGKVRDLAYRTSRF